MGEHNEWQAGMRSVKCARRGFSAIELTFALIALVVIVVVLWPMMGRTRGGSAMGSDASQARGIYLAFFVMQTNNGDRPPLPSLFDPDNLTTREPGRAKDTTANMYSLIAFQQLLTIDTFVSPMETGNVREFDHYDYTNPAAAVEPTRALWDPAFSVTLDPTRVSHASYAHLQPSAERLRGFAMLDIGPGGSYMLPRNSPPPALMPMVAMRGPQVHKLVRNKHGKIVQLDQDKTSITLLNGGRDDRWDNNVAYADGRVQWLKGPVVTDSRFLPERTLWQDALFADDADDLTGTNAFLGIFTKAGEWAEDFEAAYD